MDHARIILGFFLLCAMLHATDVTANFQNNYPQYFHFNTNMRLTTDFTATTGNTTVTNGGNVCGNSSIHIAPTTSTKWAVSSLDVESSYPTCDPAPAYCPAMINAGSVATNSDIHWLAPSVFDDQKAFADAGGYIFDYSQPLSQQYYGELSVFVNQPVTWLPIREGPPTRIRKQG